MMQSRALAFVLGLVSLGKAAAIDYPQQCQLADYAIAEGPPVSATAGNTSIRVGANNNNPNASGRNAVMIFALPAFGPGESLIGASLNIPVAGKSGSPTFNADLWGIGFQHSTAAILKYFEADSGDVGSTKIHDNIFIPSTAK